MYQDLQRTCKAIDGPCFFGEVLNFIAAVVVGSPFLWNFLTYSLCLLFSTNNTKHLSTVKAYLH